MSNLNVNNLSSMKKIFMLVGGIAIVFFGYSQTSQQQVEKIIRDPQRKTNAGKADAIISNKKIIYDSSALNSYTTLNTKSTKTTVKMKPCIDTVRQSSKARRSRHFGD